MEEEGTRQGAVQQHPLCERYCGYHARKQAAGRTKQPDWSEGLGAESAFLIAGFSLMLPPVLL